ncbi:EscU/YscU/HrcU family type III secretion system export apparatus switch protein [Leptospira idonii]|uniref:Type III secretion system protein n=1 Tax=Leptospira idonii TaxID=1193500 RepID=A0A4R9LW80_9LEPT|nr:EscU/YscU/HrcU family type III secretion system export apparatus switch protein [Leptospira idonii]TGN18533.1 type III secretion system protein [Leptospira idonii]
MRKKAVALGFDPSKNNSPAVLASGKDGMAAKICRIAEENQILLVEDSPLVDSLERLPVGSEIPKELYESVAVIFRYLLSLNAEKNN